MLDTAWMVRAGNGNELVDTFIGTSVVAVGWANLGDLTECTTRDGVKKRYAEMYDKHKAGRINTNSAQLHMLVNRIEEGGLVLTYNKDVREYHVGTISGPYQHDP